MSQEIKKEEAAVEVVQAEQAGQELAETDLADVNGGAIVEVEITGLKVKVG